MMEYKSTEELYNEALVELADTPDSELKEIARNHAYHNWYQRAATETLKQREGEGHGN